MRDDVKRLRDAARTECRINMYFYSGRMYCEWLGADEALFRLPDDATIWLALLIVEAETND